MVRLEALLPILLEDDDDHTASRSDLIGVQPLIDELADHGITTDAELLFLSPSENISIEAARTLEVLDIRNKIANFLAAEGSTADDIYRDEEAQISTSGSSMPDDLCNTGIEAVDKLLGGGWSGEVVELLGEKGVGKTWFALRTVLKHLHEHPGEQTLWLDTTASFSAELGNEILQSITQSQGSTRAQGPENQEGHSVSHTPNALDRLIVAKVFDLQSAIQAIQQVKRQDQSDLWDNSEREESKFPHEMDGVEDAGTTLYSNEVPETGRQTVTLLQSSAELSNQVLEEKDSKAPHSTEPSILHTRSCQLHLRFIVIDTVTSLLKGVLNATSAEGHARMLSFMRLLRSLTTSSTAAGRKTTIFVINDFVSLASTANSTAALHSVFPALNAKRYKAALGPTFTYLTDWTIYLSHVKDVFPQYGLDDNEEEGINRQGKRIFEVVRSRRTPQGRWALM